MCTANTAGEEKEEEEEEEERRRLRLFMSIETFTYSLHTSYSHYHHRYSNQCFRFQMYRFMSHYQLPPTHRGFVNHRIHTNLHNNRCIHSTSTVQTPTGCLPGTVFQLTDKGWTHTGDSTLLAGSPSSHAEETLHTHKHKPSQITVISLYFTQQRAYKL